MRRSILLLALTLLVNVAFAQEAKKDSLETFVFAYLPSQDQSFMTLDIQSLKLPQKDSAAFITTVYPDNNLKFKIYVGKKYKRDLKGYPIPTALNTMYNFKSFDQARKTYDSLVTANKDRMVFVDYKLKVDYNSLENGRLTRQKSKFAY